MFRNSLLTLPKDKYETDSKKMREKITLFSKDKEKKSFLPNKTITNEFIEMYDNCILNKSAANIRNDYSNKAFCPGLDNSDFVAKFHLATCIKKAAKHRKCKARTNYFR